MSHMNPYVERAFHDELEKIAVSWYTKLLATGRAGKQALDMGLGAAGRASRMDWRGANEMLRGAARRGNQALTSGSSLLGSVRQTLTQKTSEPPKAFNLVQDQLKKMRADAPSTKNLVGAAAAERNATRAGSRSTGPAVPSASPVRPESPLLQQSVNGARRRNL